MKQVTRQTIACLGWLLILVGMTWAKSPNIVLMMADDMGYECVGANGGLYPTPVLDGIAKSGMRFTNCFSTPLCTPTRVQIMSGKYNFRNYTHFGYLDPTTTTFGHLLKKGGYRTCVAGKWQLNGLSHNLAGNQDTQRPQALGFDQSCLWQVTQTVKSGERFADPLIEVNGRVMGKQIGKYGPDIFSDFICDFIRKHKDEPFFCYYPMVLVHNPFVPTPNSPAWKSGNRMRSDKRYFAEMVTYADGIVGKIIDTLHQEGLAENTLLIFTGDNGTNRSIITPTIHGPVKGAKALTIDTGIHVPMFAYWKDRIEAGTECDDLIDFTDFLPTLLEVADMELPSSDNDGRSFLPQLLGQKGNPRDHIFCHYDPRWGPMAKTPTRFVRDKRFKLYHDGRLYDTKADPLEQHPVESDSDSMQQIRHRLQESLNSMPPWPSQSQPRP